MKGHRGFAAWLSAIGLIAHAKVIELCVSAGVCVARLQGPKRCP